MPAAYLDASMNEQKNEYQEELVASKIGTDIERFSRRNFVLSVSLEVLLVDGEEQVLSLQREFGGAPEEENEICIVLSPSQLCAYNPLTKLVLSRSSLGLTFTEDAAEIFGVASLRLRFSVPDVAFDQFRKKLKILCEGQPFYACEDSAV